MAPPMKRIRAWQVWLFIGFMIVLAFIWGVEVYDLPHYLLGAESTPINWKESLIETLFTLIAALISWTMVAKYERKWIEATDELQKLACTDSLTGALSRGEFLTRAEEEFLRAKRFNRPFTCGIIDLDAFKSINDNFGHLVGDKVLAEFVQVAVSNIRQQDFIGRLGGDEFGIAFEEAASEDAQIIIQRIHEQCDKAKLLSDDGIKLTVSFSAGISSTLIADQSLTDCIRRTDKALYDAKQQGKNRIEFV